MELSGDQLLNLIGGAVLVVIVVTGVLLVSAASEKGSQTTPSDAWSLTRVNETVVQIARAPNDTVVPSNLLVAVDGTEQEVQWTGSPAAGLVGRVQVPNATIVKVYRVNESEGRNLLAHWRLAD